MGRGRPIASAAVYASDFAASTTAYALARFDFKGRAAVTTLILVTMMVPPDVLTIPLFIVMRDIGLLAVGRGAWFKGRLCPPSIGKGQRCRADNAQHDQGGEYTHGKLQTGYEGGPACLKPTPCDGCVPKVEANAKKKGGR